MRKTTGVTADRPLDVRKNTNPLRKIVGSAVVNGIVKDVLECGHELQRRDGTGTYARRCHRCRLGFPPDVVEPGQGDDDAG